MRILTKIPFFLRVFRVLRGKSFFINKDHTFSARARDIKVDDKMLTVYLEDGRIISVPIAYFPRLLNATAKQRSKWRLIGKGQGINWKEIDEDLSVEGLLRVM